MPTKEWVSLLPPFLCILPRPPSRKYITKNTFFKNCTNQNEVEFCWVFFFFLYSQTPNPSKKKRNKREKKTEKKGE
ncbi:hypothetical protein GDO86_006550 [Hymenochirus boettgeri]|uniref:Uncharacterized protein n=1 Tax=Hymenochirus boettgeri TaxID=247094 RepID=A0A8T2JBJ0_9PIPI|nr:hypothetical protein GDO86_006550 [Hymenochirus boettgeri]